MNNLFSVKDQVVVITGGTGVLGKAIAAHLAEEGAKVVILGRKAEVGNAIVNEIKAKGGEAVEGVFATFYNAFKAIVFFKFLQRFPFFRFQFFPAFVRIFEIPDCPFRHAFNNRKVFIYTVFRFFGEYQDGTSAVRATPIYGGYGAVVAFDAVIFFGRVDISIHIF